MTNERLGVLLVGCGLSFLISCGRNDTYVGGPPSAPLPDAGRGGSDASGTDAGTDGGKVIGAGGRRTGRGGIGNGGGGAGGGTPGDASATSGGGPGVDASLGDGSAGGSGGANPDASMTEGGFLDAQTDGSAICTGTADASATIACSTDRDCCASGRTCGLFVFTTPPTVSCSTPFAGGGSIGAACAGAFSENPTCKTGLCPSSFGSCSSLCADDSDCGGAPFLCRGLTVNSSPFAFCVRGCTGDPSCRSGQECVLRDSSTGLDRIEKYCRPIPTGALAPGTATTTPNNCDHGQSVTIGSATYCSAPCDTNADCAAAVPKCQLFDFVTPVTNKTVKSGLCVK